MSVVSETGALSPARPPGHFMLAADQGREPAHAHAELLARQAADERLKEGLAIAGMAVWDWDLETGRIDYSDNAASLFGRPWLSIDEVWSRVHPDDIAAIHEAVDGALSGSGSYDIMFRLTRPDNGEMAWLNSRGQVLYNAQGRAYAIRGIVIDVTERRRAEVELERVNAMLAERVAQLAEAERRHLCAEKALREADARKDQFLAMLSHELRNPLAPISAAAELLRLGRLDAAGIARTSEVIARQVGHMTALVNDLLDVSRVTRGLVVLERNQVDLRGVAGDALEQVRPLLDARGHKLFVDLPAQRVAVLGDQKRLVQVLANLLANAAKYTPDGGLIRFSVEADGVSAAVRVTDNGIGIAPDVLPHVFDLFTQAQRTPDRSQGGLGLGLALVKSLVELHGGVVTARSGGERAGSEFIVRLPLLQEQAHGNHPMQG